MADYPSNIPAFVTPGATLSSPPHSTQHTAVNAEVVAICNTLGTNPQGAEATVKDRLETIEASIGTTNHNQNTDLGTTSTTFYIGGIAGAYLRNNAGNLELKNSSGATFINLAIETLTVNGSITDGINTVSIASLKSAVDDDHTHANKGLLDTYTQTNANIASAISLKHTQGTDLGTTSETFHLNSANPSSACIKVDDLTPTIIDIRNATDSAMADIRAADFRGYLQADNADVSRPTIKYNEPSNSWQLANDGLTFVDIGTGLSLAGVAGNVQYHGTTNLGADATFTYNGGTATLSVTNLTVTGVLTASISISGTVSPTFTINSGGQALIISSAGMASPITLLGTALATAVTNTHVAATAGTGISILGQAITNSLPDQTVAIASGSGISATGTYPSFTVTNTAPDQTVAIASGTGINASGTYPNFTVALSASLDNLSDVAISGAAVDQILKYNGSNWVNGSETNVNSGSGVDFFYDTTASDIGTYQTLNRSPQNIAEQDQTAVCNSNTVLIKAFASAVAGLGGTQVDAGSWTFDVWGYTSDATLATNIQIQVLSRTEPGGVETPLFTVTSPNLTTSQALYSIVSIQQAFAISATDRLVAKVSGVTANATNTTVHFAFGGTTHYSHINTPLVVRHNDIAGLQGGSATERYHTTLAQNTALHVAVTSGTGIGVAGQVVSLSHLGIQSLVDPNAHRLMLWDDTDGSVQWVVVGTGLTYTQATHTLSSSQASPVVRNTFTNASLTAGVLTLTHSAALAAPYTVMVTIFDDNNKQIVPDAVTGSTNSVAVDLTSYGTITGTWGYAYIV